jgi:hypothetical protein
MPTLELIATPGDGGNVLSSTSCAAHDDEHHVHSWFYL